jgi:hypothetical protein
MRSGRLKGVVQIATALVVTVAWLVVAEVGWPPPVPVARAASGTFDNTTLIVIPAVGTAKGPASPYPSAINVTGLQRNGPCPPPANVDYSPRSSTTTNGTIADCPGVARRITNVK